MFKNPFWQRRSSGTILLLACKIDVVDDVVKVSDAGIDDSSVERWLLLYWKPCRILGAEIRVGTRSFIFLWTRRFSRGEIIHCNSSLGQKFSFSVLLSSDGGKIFFSTTCIIFGVDDENKVDQSLIFFFLPAFCSAEWPAETEVFKDSIESFSIDPSTAEDEAEDVVYLESW